MLASAQVAVYPLRSEHVTPAIRAVVDALAAAGLRPEIGPMSTLVTGEAETIFSALRDGFLRAASAGPLVLTVTVSNACPAPPPPSP